MPGDDDDAAARPTVGAGAGAGAAGGGTSGGSRPASGPGPAASAAGTSDSGPASPAGTSGPGPASPEAAVVVTAAVACAAALALPPPPPPRPLPASAALPTQVDGTSFPNGVACEQKPTTSPAAAAAATAAEAASQPRAPSPIAPVPPASLLSSSSAASSASALATAAAMMATSNAAVRRPRTVTTTAEIDSAIGHPGSVRINVKGAFIVESPASTPPVTGGSSPPGSSYHETKDIRLPNHTAVVSHIAVDIGGSLAKLVYFSREAHWTEPGGRLNFLNFETDRIDDCIEFMKHLQNKQLAMHGSKQGELCVMATGGGAFKYYDRIRARLGVDVLREEEMECLIIGLDFFITEIPREVFTYSETDPMHFVEPDENIYPYMLVNIGSGVSILRVSGPRTYERVGGTSLGGGTLWGLLSLLTPAESFDDMLDMAAEGDNAKVDMLVGDIYGTDYGKIGLKSTAIASSFGKVFRMKQEAEREAEDNGGLSNADSHHFASSRHDDEPAADAAHQDGSAAPAPRITREEAIKSRFSASDISRSLLYAVSNNIGQIAYLQSQIHNLNHIYFGGSFIRGHPQTMNTLSYAIKFWSKGQKQAYFLRHEGYLGSVGAFLKRQPRNWGRRGSFEEGGGEGLEARMRGRANGDGLASHGADSEEAVVI